MPSDRVVLEGDLASVAFADVLTFLSMIRKTGRLGFRQFEVEKSLLFQEGEIVFAISNVPDDQLGRFLLRNGKIDTDQFDELQRRIDSDTRVGKVLVQMGALTPKELWWGVKHQVLEIIYSLFTWNSGRFAFTETSADEVGEKITLSMSTTSIIMEGVRRLDEQVRIQEKIPNKQIIFARIAADPEDIANLELSDVELQVLESVDGHRAVHEINRLANLTEFETSRILFSLLSARLIKEIAVERLRAPVFLDVEDEPELLKVTATYNDLFSRLYGALEQKVGDDRAAKIFAKTLDGQDRSDLLQGLAFDARGRFDENLLIANVSDLPLDQRRKALDEGLDTLLSYQLFEVTQYLDPEVKKGVYRMISEAKGELEG